MKKSLKITLISAAAAVIAIAVTVCVYFIYAGQLRFVAKDSGDMQTGSALLVVSSGMSAPGGMSPDETEEYFRQLERDGYYTKAPIFTNNTDYGTEKYIKVYQSMINDYSPYLQEMAQKYENHVKIDYSVDINDKDKTVTVSFTGTGLTAEGETETFGRDYVFDVSNADESHMPVLMA